jgi:hypothetical protein
MEVVVGLSRKRTKELKRLKNEADTLLQDQREVLEHASRVVREAGRQANNYAREEVAPRVREKYDGHIRPVVDTGLHATRSVAHSAREKLTDDVFPAVGSALGSAVAVLEIAKNPQLRDAISNVSRNADKLGKKASKVGKQANKLGHEVSRNVSKKATQLGTKAGIVQPKSSGPGKYILIGIGVVALAGVAYAAWQTLRADDDLWIDDEADQADVETTLDEPTRTL